MLACGVDSNDLVEFAHPSDIDRAIYPEAASALACEMDGHLAPSDIAIEMMEVNDDENITDESREYKLAQLFREIGVEVEFEGGSDG